ncbi:hypothetical protein FGG79_20805 [Bacillus sp. BHET2]|uniref:hypothetical protein n=1 Tax=Bacillus sp. BHET2 TaxID=2583818 RepID=UPI00110EDB68|nr:hypothetical protein [Bacillus sp. BHET2]TMU82724.1 hypothetical protein FGG79_20805 [Bacillus sp. BHET2]
MLNITRVFSLMLTFTILFWNVFPVVSMAAGTFITPGESFKPGQAITPGEAISGGEFLVPGDVFKPGQAIKPEESYNGGQVSNSGKPILENFPLNNGTFIIPNAPPPVPNFVFGGESFTTGGPITPGTHPDSGKSIEGGSGDGTGDAVEGGSGDGTGDAVEGGSGDGTGDAIEGGSGDGTGDTIEGGSGDGTGDTIEGGSGDGTGDTIEGGSGDGTGDTIEGGSGDGTGDTVEGGSGDGTGGTIEGGSGDGNGGKNSINNAPPSLLNLWVKSSDGERGLIGNLIGGLKDVKTYILGFGDKMAQAGVSYYAGFKFKDLGNGNYSIYGDEKINNKIGQWFYERYKSYKIDDKDAFFGPKSRHVGQAKINDFLDSKSLKGKAGFWRNMGKNTMKSLKESWVPFSKSFWKPSNMLKLGGPVNVALSSFNSIYDYGFGDDASKRGKGLASTDFAATLTTDVAIGIGSTAIGSIASSAATGALVGSTVPVVGTAIGAVVGLGAGLLTTYAINGTATGRRIKAGATKAIKGAYDWGVDKAKSGYDFVKTNTKTLSKGMGWTLKKIGGLFG